MIYVTSLDKLDLALETVRPSRLISLMPHEELEGEVTRPDFLTEDDHLIVSINDISEEIEGLIAPQRYHVEAIIAFTRAWAAAHAPDDPEPMVIHCRMGVSRSGAAAYIALCTLSAPGQERAIAQEMRRRAPHIQPNILMVALADEILGRDGRMYDAIEELGWGTGYNAMDWLAMELWRETQ